MKRKPCRNCLDLSMFHTIEVRDKKGKPKIEFRVCLNCGQIWRWERRLKPVASWNKVPNCVVTFTRAIGFYPAKYEAKTKKSKSKKKRRR